MSAHNYRKCLFSCLLKTFLVYMHGFDFFSCPIYFFLITDSNLDIWFIYYIEFDIM